MRRTALMLALAALAATACSSKTELIRSTQTIVTPINGIQSHTPQAGQRLGFPTIATKNTTRVAGADPVADAAGVALAVYPSAVPGTHPQAVVIAPTDDWEASIAASVLMSSPLRAPLLLSGPGSLPSASRDALSALAPTGAGAIDGAQVISVGDTPVPGGFKASTIGGSDPASLAAAIDRFATAVAGRPSADVVVASTTDPAYAMPAAGWAAESGDPVLFVTGSSIPAATQQALIAHQHPHIYVLGPPSVIPDSVLGQLGRYGTVKRVGAQGPDANSVAFATYRDPPCAHNQPCVHVPGSFGWALTSPGHGYTLLNAGRPLDAAAAAPLSASGTYGPELVIENADQMPTAIVNYFEDYATPGYSQEGPTAAVYNHGWVIGDQTAVSVAVQAEMDSLLEVVAIR